MYSFLCDQPHHSSCDYLTAHNISFMQAYDSYSSVFVEVNIAVCSPQSSELQLSSKQL